MIRDINEMKRRIQKTGSPIIKFSYMPFYDTIVAFHSLGFQSEVSSEVRAWIELEPEGIEFNKSFVTNPVVEGPRYPIGAISAQSKNYVKPKRAWR